MSPEFRLPSRGEGVAAPPRLGQPTLHGCLQCPDQGPRSRWLPRNTATGHAKPGRPGLRADEKHRGRGLCSATGGAIPE